MSFKKRMGLESEKILQIDSMDEDLRRKIWDRCYFLFNFDHQVDQNQYVFAREISLNILKLSLEDFDYYNCYERGYHIGNYSNGGYKIEHFRGKLKQFILTAECYDVCELIDVLCKNSQAISMESWNELFEEENFGYRLSKDGDLLPITNEIELQEIENTKKLSKESSEHFQKAISCFSKKGNTDYEKVIEESIKGLEATCREVTGLTNKTLGDCLKYLKKNDERFKIFFEGLEKIWGFSSNHFRHAKQPDGVIPDFSDAKLILLLSSAISNYLYEKQK